MKTLLAFLLLLSQLVGCGESEQSKDQPQSGTTEPSEAEPKKAIVDFTEAIRLNPDSAEAYVNRGVTYAKKKEYDKAIADYTEAIRFKPDDAKAYVNRSLAYNKKGDKAKVSADRSKAKELPDKA